MTIQPITLILIGALLLALVTVETGGWFLTRVARGLAPANDLQKSFFRAGHAHAGVLLVLSIAILGAIDAAGDLGPWTWPARILVPIAALLMPAGFFLSVLGANPDKPNRLIALVWIGGFTLAAGLIVSGIAFLGAGIAMLSA